MNYGGASAVAGPVSLTPPAGVNCINVETAEEMLKACTSALPASAFISVAAVADWRPAKASSTKLKLKGKEPFAGLELTENPDILKTISNLPETRPELVVGFAAETNDVEKHARGKLDRKGCDWIIANDVSGDVMGCTHNQVALYRADGVEHSDRADKSEIARWIATRIADHLTR